MTDITPAMVDCILYNRHAWRSAAEALEPGTAGDIVRLPMCKSQESRVEALAVSRATVLIVLDAVEYAVMSLPRETRRLMKLRYEEQWSLKMVARREHWGEMTVRRRLQAAKRLIAGVLTGLGDEKLVGFWCEVGRVLVG